MNNETKSATIAQRLIENARIWNKLCEKEKRNGMRVRRLDGLDEPSPGEKAQEIRKTIASLDEETLKEVLKHIEERSAEADKGIEANGGSYFCEAGHIKKACNAVKSFVHFVKEDKAKADETGSEWE